MDIAALSVMKNQAQLKKDVGTSLMKKVMDTAEQNSGLMDQMLDKVDQGNAAAQARLPHVGNNVNVRV
ncbi:MAG: putative motility protein [Firmicutes bacterium]|nr:putative motility protein [Bacillota bacterium]